MNEVEKNSASSRKKVLLINGKKSFGHSKGILNQHLTDTAELCLKELGHEVMTTNVDAAYSIEDEINKWLESDIVIYQMPGWWMGPPWIIKKYMDEVFTEGHGKLYTNDGRTRSDPSKKYGSGGLLQGKKYLLSLTWNAPIEAFNDPGDFFGGVGFDDVYLATHKAHEFLGMTKLPTFMCNNVIKDPDIDIDTQRYKNHLTSIFN